MSCCLGGRACVPRPCGRLLLHGAVCPGESWLPRREPPWTGSVVWGPGPSPAPIPPCPPSGLRENRATRLARPARAHLLRRRRRRFGSSSLIAGDRDRGSRSAPGASMTLPARPWANRRLGDRFAAGQ